MVRKVGRCYEFAGYRPQFPTKKRCWTLHTCSARRGNLIWRGPKTVFTPAPKIKRGDFVEVQFHKRSHVDVGDENAVYVIAATDERIIGSFRSFTAYSNHLTDAPTQEMLFAVSDVVAYAWGGDFPNEALLDWLWEEGPEWWARLQTEITGDWEIPHDQL